MISFKDLIAFLNPAWHAAQHAGMGVVATTVDASGMRTFASPGVNTLDQSNSVTVPASVTGWNPGLTLGTTYSIQAGSGGPNGTYYYYVTGEIGVGLETACTPTKPANPIVTGGAVASITLLNVPTFPDARVVSRKIYRSKNAVSDGFDTLGKDPQLVGSINDNTTNVFVDNVPDAGLGVFGPFVDTTALFWTQRGGSLGNIGGTANYYGIGGPSARNLGYYCFGFGSNNLRDNAGGVRNVAIGGQCLMTNTTGSGNVAVGIHANGGNTTGNSNVSMGYGALQASQTGNSNVAIGQSALAVDVGSGTNTAVGFSAGLSQTTGNQSSYFGWKAGANITTGIGNTFVGYAAGGASGTPACTGNGNTVVGSNAGAQLTGIGSHNTLVGYAAGSALQAAYYNVAVGEYAGSISTSGTNNIWLGFCAGKYATASNEFYVNNQDRTNLTGDKTLSLMYGVMAATAAAQQLTVNAALKTLTSTVSALPSAATVGVGFRAFVTDANASTFNSVVAGGGSTPVPVFSDGTAWRIG